MKSTYQGPDIPHKGDHFVCVEYFEIVNLKSGNIPNPESRIFRIFKLGQLWGINSGGELTRDWDDLDWSHTIHFFYALRPGYDISGKKLSVSKRVGRRMKLMMLLALALLLFFVK